MQKYGVQRRVVSRDELLQHRARLQIICHRIVGGTYTPATKAAMPACSPRRWRNAAPHARRAVSVQPRHRALEHCRRPVMWWCAYARHLATNARCKAMPWWWPAALQRAAAARVGVDLPIYPGKGYSATFNCSKGPSWRLWSAPSTTKSSAP
jgi:D-amino-acid dehydrogenase